MISGRQCVLSLLVYSIDRAGAPQAEPVTEQPAGAFNCTVPAVQTLTGADDWYRGWYDTRGCGRCLDYCRWSGASGGHPMFNATYGDSVWTCTLGDDGGEVMYGIGLRSWGGGKPLPKCVLQGGDAPRRAPAAERASCLPPIGNSSLPAYVYASGGASVTVDFLVGTAIAWTDWSTQWETRYLYTRHNGTFYSGEDPYREVYQDPGSLLCNRTSEGIVSQVTVTYGCGPGTDEGRPKIGWAEQLSPCRYELYVQVPACCSGLDACGDASTNETQTVYTFDNDDNQVERVFCSAGRKTPIAYAAESCGGGQLRYYAAAAMSPALVHADTPTKSMIDCSTHNAHLSVLYLSSACGEEPMFASNMLPLTCGARPTTAPTGAPTGLCAFQPKPDCDGLGQSLCFQYKYTNQPKPYVVNIDNKIRDQGGFKEDPNWRVDAHEAHCPASWARGAIGGEWALDKLGPYRFNVTRTHPPVGAIGANVLPCSICPVRDLTGPTESPSVAPSVPPSGAPSASPSTVPSATPSSESPPEWDQPTALPRNPPARPPSATPTGAPTTIPTANPSARPTTTPSTTPTVAPSTSPTAGPTATPSTSPTAGPTVTPSTSPTAGPTVTPSTSPTADPTVTPSTSPTAGPTVTPSTSPAAGPTVTPSTSGTAGPSFLPTQTPSVSPTAGPSTTPTIPPTRGPTASPERPTTGPSASPSRAPSSATQLPAFLSGLLAVDGVTAEQAVTPQWQEQLRCTIATAAGSSRCTDAELVAVWTNPVSAEFRVYENAHLGTTVALIETALHSSAASQQLSAQYPGVEVFTAPKGDAISFQLDLPWSTPPALVCVCLAELLDPNAIFLRAGQIFVQAGQGSEKGRYFVSLPTDKWPAGAEKGLEALFEIPLRWTSTECTERLKEAASAAEFNVLADGLDEAATVLPDLPDAIADTFAQGGPLSIGVPRRTVRAQNLRPARSGGVAFALRVLLPRGGSPAVLGQLLLGGGVGAAPSLVRTGALISGPRGTPHAFRLRKESLAVRVVGLPGAQWQSEKVLRAAAEDLAPAARGGCSAPCGWAVSVVTVQDAPDNWRLTVLAAPDAAASQQRLLGLRALQLPQTAAALAAAGLTAAGSLALSMDIPGSPPIVEAAPAAAVCEGGAVGLVAWAPAVGVGEWEPRGLDYYPSRTSPWAAVSGLAPGLALLRWVVGAEAANVMIWVSGRPAPAIRHPAANLELDSSAPLWVEAVPAGPNQTGIWTTDSPDIVLQHAASSKALVDGFPQGTTQLFWTVSAPSCTPASAVAVRTVRVRRLCNPARCLHGSCFLGPSCKCHSSVATGFWATAEGEEECSVCQPGWRSPETGCKERICTAATCPPKRGTCTDGECKCALRFRGPACGECAAAFSGPNCTECAADLYSAPGAEPCSVQCNEALCNGGSGTGVRGCTAEGECDCGPRRAGATCGQCRAPWRGWPLCTTRCATDECGMGCCRGADGCIDSDGTQENGGMCICHRSAGLGYWRRSGGPTGPCNACVPGFGPPGSCRRQVEQECTPGLTCINGRCTSAGCSCNKGWGGIACDRCAASAADGYWGGANCSECAPWWHGPSCDRPCGCRRDNSVSCSRSGECICRRGFTGAWSGPTCASCCTKAQGCEHDFLGPACSQYCEDEMCSGHGRCGPEGRCVCFRDSVNGHWDGLRCSHCASTAHGMWAGADCKHCPDGWFPHGKCTRECFDIITCHGHGRCNPDGLCQCNSDPEGGHWAGQSCTRCAEGFMWPGCTKRIVGTTYCPVEATAYFSPTRGVIHVNFSVDMAAESSSCAGMLDFDSCVDVGEGATCILPQPRRLDILLDPERTADALLPGDLISIASGLRPVVPGRSCALWAGTLLVTAPFTAPPPRVQLHGPGQLSPCGEARFTAFVESGTSEYDIIWRVVNMSHAAEAAAAGARGQGTLLLGAGAVTGKSRSAAVEVTVADRLGAQASAVHEVLVAAAPPPQLEPVTATEPLLDYSAGGVLGVRATHSGCAGAWGADTALSWDAPGNPGLIGGSVPASNSTVLVIPPGALRATWSDGAEPSRVLLRVREAGGDEQLFSVGPLRLPPRCTVRGGSRDGLNPDIPVSVSAWIQDPMNAEAEPRAQWDCELLGRVPGPCPAGALSSSSGLGVALDPIAAGASSAYPVRITLTASVGSRECVDSVVYRFARRGGPVPLAFEISHSATHGAVAPYTRVAMRITGLSLPPTGETRFMWACPSLNLSDPALSPLGPTGPSLLLSPAALMPAAVYDITASVLHSDGANTAEGTASVRLQTVVAPDRGRLRVHPLVSEPPYAPLRLSAEAWASPTGGQLMYEFANIDSSGRRRVLSEWGASSVTSYFPSAPSGNDVEEVTFILGVKDSITFAVTEVTASALVVAPGESTEMEEERATSVLVSVPLLEQGAVADPSAVNNAVVSLLSIPSHDSSDDSCGDLARKLLRLVQDPVTPGQRGQVAYVLQSAAACGLTTAYAASNPGAAAELADHLLRLGLDAANGTQAYAVDEGAATALANAAAAVLGVLGTAGDIANDVGRRAAALQNETRTQAQWQRTANFVDTILFSAMRGAADGESVDLAADQSDLQMLCIRAHPHGAMNDSGRAFAGSSGPGRLRWGDTPRDAAHPDASVDICATQWPSNPIEQVYGEANSTVSRMYSYRVGSSAGSVLHPVNNSFSFVIPSNLSEMPANASWIPRCAWWDVSVLNWSHEGCSTEWDNDTATATCVCSHLTDYALTGLPTTIPIDFGKLISRLAQARFDPAEAQFVAATFLIVLAVGGLVMSIVAACITRRDYHRQLLLECDEDEARARGVQRWAYNSEAPQTYADATLRPLAMDEGQTVYHADYGCSFLAVRLSESVQRIQSEHPWLRPFTANTGDFDAPRRMAVLLCLVACVLIVGAALFRSLGENDLSLSMKVVFLIATLLCSGVLVRTVDPLVSYLLMHSARPVDAEVRRRRASVDRLARQKLAELSGEWWELSTTSAATGSTAGKRLSVDSDSTLLRRASTDSAGYEAAREKAVAILEVFDDDGDGALSLPEFNNMLNFLFPSSHCTSGDWSAGVFSDMLTEIGADSGGSFDPGRAALDAYGVLCFYLHPGSPGFQMLDNHYNALVLSVTWADAVDGRNFHVRQDHGRLTCSADRVAPNDLTAIVSLGNGCVELQEAATQTSRLHSPPRRQLCSTLPLDYVLRRRLQLLCRIAEVQCDLGPDPVYTPGPQDTPSRDLHRADFGEDLVPWSEQQPTTASPGPGRASTRASDWGDEDRSAASAGDARLPAATVEWYNKGASPPLSDRPTADSAPLVEPAPDAPKKVVSFVDLVAQRRESVDALQRRHSTGCSDDGSGLLVPFPTSVGSSSGSKSLLSRGRSAEALSYRLARRRSQGSSDLVREVEQRLPAMLGEAPSDPLHPWTVLADAPAGPPFSLFEAGEVLRGEVACNRALCAVAVAAHIALRGGHLPSDGDCRVDPDAALAGEDAVVNRPYGEKLGLVVQGDPLHLKGVTDGGAAQKAHIDKRYLGRRLTHINGRPATLAALRAADSTSGDVALRFAEAVPQPGDTVGPRPCVALGGCLRQGTRGVCIRVRQSSEGGFRVLVRRTLRKRRWEDWYAATDLVVFDRDATTVGLRADEISELEAELDLVRPDQPPPADPSPPPQFGWGRITISALLDELTLRAGARHVHREEAWLEQHLWQRDVNRAAWRVGLELVAERHFALAAAVFEVVPLLLNPDLFFLLYPLADCSADLTLAGAVGRAVAKPRIGRIWVQHYAHLHLGPGPWDAPDWVLGEIPARQAGPFVTAVLGLQDCYAPFAGFGGASFHLKIEDVPIATWVDVESLVASRRLLEAAHLARFVRKCTTKHSRWEHVHRRFADEPVLHFAPCGLVIERTAARIVHSVADGFSKRASPYSGFYPRSTVRKMGCCDRAAAGVLQPLLGDKRLQGSFYGSLEYGRLLALFLTVKRSGISLQAAVLRLLRQERRAVERRDRCGLQFTGTCDDEVPSDQGLRGLHDKVQFFAGAAADPRRDYCSGTPNNNCGLCDHFRPNPYLTAVLCVRLRASGAGGLDNTMRHTTPNYPQLVDHTHYSRDEVWGLLPFAQLGRFLYPAAGSGLAINPHRGLPQAASSARVGDTILLHPGEYHPTRLEGLCGTERSPVRIVSLSFGLEQDRLRRLHRGLNLGERKAKQQLLPEQRLPPDEKSAVFRSQRYQGRDAVLLQLCRCRHLQLAGLRFRAASGTQKTIAVSMPTSSDVQVRECAFFGFANRLPFALGRWTRGQELDYSQVNYFETRRWPDSAWRRLVRGISSMRFPSWMRFAGYVWAWTVFLGLLLVTLFITAGYTDSEVVEWAARAGFTVVFDMVVLQPLIIMLRSMLERLCGGVDGGAEVSTDAMADITMA